MFIIGGKGLPFLSIDLPKAVGLGLRVEEQNLFAVPCAGPRPDLRYQGRGERDPTLGAPSAAEGGAAARA